MQKNNKNIEEKVIQILADKLDDIKVDRIKIESTLVDDLGMDSFGAVELSFAIKDEFGVEIIQEDFAKVKNVKDIVQYVLNHIDRRSADA